jgi:RNA polymerase sigma-70 factor (ECF subfamily)
VTDARGHGILAAVLAPTDADFRTQLEPHRREITLHCYRMLGSLQDGEEVAQESLLRAWQRLGDRKSSDSTRAWLHQIATNACLDVLKTRRRRRALPHLLAPAAAAGTALGAPAREDVWIEPAPDALLDVPDAAEPGPSHRVSVRESIGLAFVTALQLLSPKQRAVLLLVDVLGYRPEETASLLGTTTASVNSLLQRARKSAEAHTEGDAPAPGPDDDALLRRYITTWESGDLDAFAALLAEDARLSMPPQPEWFEGREAICAFLAHVMRAMPHRYRLVPVKANGQNAVGVYSAPLGGGEFRGQAINVIAMRGGYVTTMTRFAKPNLFRLFGLPETLPASPSVS